MKFYSTRNPNKLVSATQALVNGLADDGGLYMPLEIPLLNYELIAFLGKQRFQEIAFKILNIFFGEDISEVELRQISEEAFSFPLPLKQVSENIYSLELFHGPTLAFKDFGARFLARALSAVRKNSNKELTVLVATSGDTGSAVAHGFYKVPGIKVVLLYPSGKVSHLQEKQLTTLDENIKALEIKGTFDDCQAMVKQAFGDRLITSKKELTSANSINIGRLFPQSLYYFYAWGQLAESKVEPIFSVPSGNLGNLTAGVIAKKMGLPVKKFIAATNNNDVFVRYLQTGEFIPKPSIQTCSNAMDVGNPSNMVRLQNLYGGRSEEMRKDIYGASFSDEETKKAIASVYKKHDYLLDPHGAVGYLALEELLSEEKNALGVVLETAHPAKFVETVNQATGTKPLMPAALSQTLDKPKKSIICSNKYEDFRELLLAL